MITTIMAAFAFGYCVMDIVLNYHYNKKNTELLKSTIETKR